MFRYNRETKTIEDIERGVQVNRIPGPGHNIFVGEVVGDGWKFQFLYSSESDRYTFKGTTAIENPEYHASLHVRHRQPEGNYNLSEPPIAIAREAALAREVDFFGLDPARITFT